VDDEGSDEITPAAAQPDGNGNGSTGGPDATDADHDERDERDEGDLPDPDSPWAREPVDPAPASAVGRRARHVVTDWVASLRPRGKDTRADAVAGLPGAVASVPDGMAMALLVGVNPAYGLYASFAGKIGGGLFSSTTRMVVTSTTAAALAAGSVLADLPEAGRDSAVVTLTLFVGVILVVAGLLHLGRYIRFVSRSVMVGFLTGISLNIVFGQLPGLLGVRPDEGRAVDKVGYVAMHLNEITIASSVVGVGALLVMLLLSRTRAALLSTLIAVVVSTAVVVVAGWDEVRTVADVGTIPSGLPPLVLPTWYDLLNVSLLSGAAAIAAIILVQGAGVAESAPNPDGTPSSTNRDLIGQGVGNLASALVHGIPVGGSVSTTAINLAAGARSRWSTIFAGLWMLVILLALGGVVSMVPMPTLSAVLIFAALMSMNPMNILVVWRTSITGKIAMSVTFLSTLLLPIAAAVAVGVICSLVLQLNKEQMDFRLVRLVHRDDGFFVERPAPRVLPDAEPVILDVYGSLLYAGARTLGARLPDPRHTRRPVVILRLRGRGSLGSTFFAVIEMFADELHRAGGRLYLSGLQQHMVRRFERSQQAEVREKIAVFPATPVLGESTLAALADARQWLADQPPWESDTRPDGPGP